jgi:hypothetical protein
MSDLEIPNFGDLLRTHLDGVTAGAFPYLLSRLERTAADRYRGWAQDVPEHAEGLLACAAREDEIADRAAALFPPNDDERAQVEAMIGPAKDTYYKAFEGYTPVEQMTLQAAAERQGSGAWETLAVAYPHHAEALRELSAIEIQSADYLDELLPTLTS